MGSWSVDGKHEDGVVDDHGDDGCPNVIGSLTMKRLASLMPKILWALAMVTPYFPTLLVVDDLHWAAAESLDLYRYIMSETPHPLCCHSQRHYAVDPIVNASTTAQQRGTQHSHSGVELADSVSYPPFDPLSSRPAPIGSVPGLACESRLP